MVSELFILFDGRVNGRAPAVGGGADMKRLGRVKKKEKIMGGVNDTAQVLGRRWM